MVAFATAFLLLTEKLKPYVEIKVNFASENFLNPGSMEKNYTAKNETAAQPKPSGVSMKTKLLLAKIGLAICIVILIVAKSIGH